jgi:hypothetical protein
MIVVVTMKFLTPKHPREPKWLFAELGIANAIIF